VVAAALFCCLQVTLGLEVGINIDPMNTNWGLPSTENVTTLGATWVRIEFKDNSTGDPSMFDFYDPIIGDFVNSGVNVLLLLDYDSYPGRPQPVRPCAV
jgi:hypothetical protein